MTVTILIGDVRDELKKLPTSFFDCVVTSPPYWGLRDYGVKGQIGLEPTLGEHLDVLVGVFREVWRVLKPQGTLWLNYGDCYAAAPNGKSAAAYKADGTDDRTFRDKPFSTVGAIYEPQGDRCSSRRGRSGSLGNGGINGIAQPDGRVVAGGTLKPKDLCMIPNRLAIALQDDGWWVRSEIIWRKPNPMPESVYDRPTTAHEKIWLLTKGEDYFYNHEAIREPVTGNAHARKAGPNSRENKDRTPRSRKPMPAGWDQDEGAHGNHHRQGRRPGVTPKSAAEDNPYVKAKASFHATTTDMVETRNARNVWTIAPKPFREAHFATFPPELAERCIKAGTPTTTCGLCAEPKTPADCGGMCASIARQPGRVLDPFGGAGTVALVAEDLGMDSTIIELNPEYAAIARQRVGLDDEPQALAAD